MSDQGFFTGDAFSVVRLTQALNDLKFVPGRLEELNIFQADFVATTSIAVERQGDILVIVPPSPRGGPGHTIASTTRDLHTFAIPHFEINDAVYADTVQNIRAFGDESALQSVMTMTTARLKTASNSMAATEEHSRMGAVRGIVTYADGSTLNLFNEFGVTQAPEIDFDLDNAAPMPGALRRACASVTRQIGEALGGIPFNGIHALCGDNFFDDLLAHVEVREAFIGWTEAKILREGYVGPNRKSYGIFEFGGIVFENYRGATIPSAAKDGAPQTFISTDKMQAFPLGVPGLFKTVYAPADYVETVNTLGKRLYARTAPWANSKGMALDTQMNALQYCSRPKVLVSGRRT